MSEMAANTEGRCTLGKQRYWWGVGGQVEMLLGEQREWVYLLGIA